MLKVNSYGAGAHEFNSGDRAAAPIAIWVPFRKSRRVIFVFNLTPHVAIFQNFRGDYLKSQFNGKVLF